MNIEKNILIIIMQIPLIIRNLIFVTRLVHKMNLWIIIKILLIYTSIYSEFRQISKSRNAATFNI